MSKQADPQESQALWPLPGAKGLVQISAIGTIGLTVNCSDRANQVFGGQTIWLNPEEALAWAELLTNAANSAAAKIGEG